MSRISAMPGLRSKLQPKREYAGTKVLIEFVSANPNNPITATAARGGAIGDALANILTALGCRVTREFYINDALNMTQMRHFGKSLEVRYMQTLGHDTPMPQDGYQGDYVIQLARRIVQRDGDRHILLLPEERSELFTRLGEEEMLAMQREDLAAFGVEFDNWYHERELYEKGKVDIALKTLKEHGYTYESEGALWLKSSLLGDKIDRALVRDNGEPTYIASDAAYHADKFERGFDRLINVWGPQHRGYVARTRAAVQALGQDPDRLDIVIYQDVQVFWGGEMVSMSRRRGEHILLRELLDEVGKDTVRFFLLSRPIGEQIDFDLELIEQQGPDNPLYCVRSSLVAMREACRWLKDAGHTSSAGIEDSNSGSAASVKEPSGRRLNDLCAGWPDVLRQAAEKLEPHIIWQYATQLAAAYDSFARNGEMTPWRAAQAEQTYHVLQKALQVLGLSVQAELA